MTTLLRTIFGSGSGSFGARSPSFNDFNLGWDAESDLAVMDDTPMPETQPPADQPAVRPARGNVWHSTFSPGTNDNMKTMGRSMYDAVDGHTSNTSVWANILKADTIQRLSFKAFDQNNDGKIDAADLRRELGPHTDAELLIKQADKNGDGKIDVEEFCELFKNT